MLTSFDRTQSELRSLAVWDNPFAMGWQRFLSLSSAEEQRNIGALGKHKAATSVQLLSERFDSPQNGWCCAVPEATNKSGN